VWSAPRLQLAAIQSSVSLGPLGLGDWRLSESLKETIRSTTGNARPADTEHRFGRVIVAVESRRLSVQMPDAVQEVLLPPTAAGVSSVPASRLGGGEVTALAPRLRSWPGPTRRKTSRLAVVRR
jgi:hypothetical protein